MNNNKRTHDDEEQYPNKKIRITTDMEDRFSELLVDDILFVIASELIKTEIKSLLSFTLVSRRFSSVVRSKRFWEHSGYSKLIQALKLTIDTTISESALAYFIAKRSLIENEEQISTLENQLKLLHRKGHNRIQGEFITFRKLTESAFSLFNHFLYSLRHLPTDEIIQLFEDKIPRKTRTNNLYGRKITWYPGDTYKGFTLAFTSTVNTTRLWIWKNTLTNHMTSLYIFVYPLNDRAKAELAIINYKPPRNTLEMKKILIDDQSPFNKMMWEMLESDPDKLTVLEHQSDIVFRAPEPRTLCSFSENSFADSGVTTLIIEQLFASPDDILKLRVISKRHYEIVHLYSTWKNLGYVSQFERGSEEKIPLDGLKHLIVSLKHDKIVAEITDLAYESTLPQKICNDAKKQLKFTKEAENEVDAILGSGIRTQPQKTASKLRRNLMQFEIQQLIFLEMHRTSKK